METDSAEQNISQDIFKLIQPDLLSVDELVIILKEVLCNIIITSTKWVGLN